MNRRTLCRALTLPWPLALLARQAAAEDLAQSVRANGVRLHYVEQGKGVPVLFVHGGLEDYRGWQEQVAAFSASYRALAYSRRYSYPNRGAASVDNYSAITDADDLAAFIAALALQPAHIVGESYGGYVALFLAVRHPKLVRSLILSEPPVLHLLPGVTGGRALFDEFMAKVWKPTTIAFRIGNEAGVKAAVDGFGELGYSGTDQKMTFADLPPEVRTALLENAPEWKELTRSKNAFPSLSRDLLRRVEKPTMLMGGARSLRLAGAIDGVLLRTLPDAERVLIAKATHDMWIEYPQECRDATIAFLSKH